MNEVKLSFLIVKAQYFKDHVIEENTISWFHKMKIKDGKMEIGFAFLEHGEPDLHDQFGFNSIAQYLVRNSDYNFKAFKDSYEVLAQLHLERSEMLKRYQDICRIRHYDEVKLTFYAAPVSMINNGNKYKLGNPINIYKARVLVQEEIK